MRRLTVIGTAVVIAAALVALVAGDAGSAPKSATDTANFAGWLAETVKKRLVEEFAGRGETVESITVSVPSLYRPPEEYDSFDISLPGQNRNGANVFVLITFYNAGRAVSKVNVIASVEISRDVVVARRDIARGAIIGADDLAIERRSVRGLTGDRLLSDVSQAEGRQTDRKIKEGTAIRSTLLSRPKMVRSGDVVTVIAESGSMRITITGKAKQDGDRGEWIRVTNIESKKTINARVVAPGELMVEF